MKKYFVLFFLLSCCTSNKNITNKFSNIEFSNDLSIEEFKIRLNEYTNNSPYPNID